MISFQQAPFHLKEEEIIHLQELYNKMSIKERIGQLFCPIIFSKEEAELKKIIEEKCIGGALYREGKGIEIKRAHEILQNASKIPLLLASNLESGGDGSAIEGTYYGKQMLVAATGKKENAYRLGKISASEGAVIGANLALAPVVDIDRNPYNPITNVRTFGSDVQTITDMASEYIKGAKSEGVASCIKHFPGDGIDDRDQHLLTSVNYLSCEEWDESFGKIYKTLIDEGALTLMAGHIALPAYEEYYDKRECESIVPATLSKNILQKLLRQKLGFNGLIISDATPMVGFCAAMERKMAVPLCIENGCDMFLFNRHMDEDFRYMMEGYENKILSEERLEEAVKRILATKMAMGLISGKQKSGLIPDDSALGILGNAEHIKQARECADEGITLVKNRANILPISPDRHKRVLLELMGDAPSDQRVAKSIIEKLEKEGFAVTLYTPESFEVLNATVEDFKKKYDLVLYIGNVETASNKTVARLHWHTMFGLGNNMPWMVKEMDTVFISLGNPYHLLDVPMIGTYINAYCNSEIVIEAVIEKIMGRSAFKGISPVDAFCKRMDLKL